MVRPLAKPIQRPSLIDCADRVLHLPDGRSRTGHRPRPHLAQHFLCDPEIIANIVGALAPQRGDVLFEIGPGKGALSIPLVQYPVRFFAVERDPALVLALRRRLPATCIYEADILDFDLQQLACRTLRVVGNLPYNIGTEILFRLVRFHGFIRDLLVMLQKELVQRMVAGPRSPGRSRLSIMCQTWYEMEVLFDVSPLAFRPVPKVDSTVLRLHPAMHWRQRINDESHYTAMVRTAFSQRRKVLRNSLPDAVWAMAQLGIDVMARPETLAIGDFVALSNLLSSR